MLSLAAGAAALAVWWWHRPTVAAGVILAVLTTRRLVLAIVPAAIGLVVLLGLHGRALVLLGLGAVVAGWGRHIIGRRRVARAADRRRAEVIALCEALASDVAAGLPLSRVVARAGHDFAGFAELAAIVDVGGDVPSVLRRLAQRPGYDELRFIAAGWQVSAEAGSGLAEVLGRLSVVLSARQRTRRLVEAELASSRATAAIMALLPLGVLALGSSVGGDPWGFLLGSTPGLVCLGAGLTLTMVGLSWLQSIQTAAVS